MTEQDIKTSSLRIESDFRSDWTAILKAEIQSLGLGYVVDQTWDERTISDVFFNLLRRTIETRQRTVLQSRELTCPAKHTRGLEQIRIEATKGQNLNPRLSREIQNALYDDALLNDWDINHLHLGLRLEKNGQIEGTDYILFARVTHDILYMIDVLPHGSWSDKRLVEIVHRNWPATIGVSKILGAIDLEHNSDEEDIKILRKGKLNTLLKMDDGTIYCPPGGGVTASGVSVEVVENSNYHFGLVDRIEEHCRDNASEFMESAVASGPTNSTDLRFELLRIGDGYASVLEQHSGTRFRIPL